MKKKKYLMRNKNVSSTTPTHKKVMVFFYWNDIFCLLLSTHTRILGFFYFFSQQDQRYTFCFFNLINNILNNIFNFINNLINNMSYFILNYIQPDSFFPQKSVLHALGEAGAGFQYVQQSVSQLYFHFSYFFHLKLSTNGKIPHFLAVTNGLLLHFCIAKSVYCVLPQVQ